MATARNTKTVKRSTKKVPIFAAVRDVRNVVFKKDNLNIPASDALNQVMKWGKLNKIQAALFSLFTCNTVSGEANWWQLDDIQQYLNLSACDYIQYVPDLDYLLSHGFFTLRYNIPYVAGTATLDTYFCIPDEIIDAMSYNKPFTPYFPPESHSKNDCLTFLFRSQKEGFFNNKLNYYWKLAENLYKDDPVVKLFIVDQITDPGISAPLMLSLFVRVGISLLAGNSSVPLKEMLTDVKDSDPAFISNELKFFKNEKSVFIKKRIFKVDKTQLGDNLQIGWGDWAKKIIFKDNEEFLTTALQSKELGLIRSKDIKERKLFYNEENQQDIDRLSNLLQEDKYQGIRKRLDEKNMPKGMIILLYGPPGTGKTETVMQLARNSGRDLFHVNIQEVRSCWVGETEKNTKQIFEAYRSSNSGLKPILLFNEADGIISKRSSITGGKNESVDKMENAMQNIILEELENFDGICILTTNLVTNFDAAFDRRILFKIKLENPKLDTKMKIWKSKVDTLTDEDARKVSESFDFSGGQIENIRRKITLDEVLYGNKVTIDTLMDFCKKEKFDTGTQKHIGFTG
jgi:hypothetical protein